MSRLIDTHFHIDHYRNHENIFKTINELEQYTLCVTNSPGVFLSCQHIYKETKYIKFALGIHPCEVKSIEIIKDFKYCISKTNYIGEIGLDFSPQHIKYKDIQIAVFDEVLRLGTKDNKLISIHSRKSEEVLIDILNKYKHKKCIIHWFNGNTEQLNKLINLGCYFSVNSSMNLSHIKKIPIDKILIESDGPYMKLNSRKYTPNMLKEIYNVVATRLEINNLDSIVYQNFKNILSL